MAKVLVMGASRGIGLETVKAALAQGHNVRALARHPQSIAVSHPNLEKIKGDALNPTQVKSALEHIDVVVQTLGVTAGLDMILGPVRLFSKSTSVLIPAMEEIGAKRLISVSGFGAGDSHARLGCLQGTVFRLILGQAYADKDIQEELIRESDLDWVIVRPVILTNGNRTGRYKIIIDPKKWRNGFISRKDVADFLVRQVDDERYLGQTPLLTY